MTTALRVLAIVIALAGLVDPALARKRPAPLALDVMLPAAHDPTYAGALRARDALAGALGDVAMNSGEAPRAVVVIGNAPAEPKGEIPTFRLGVDPGARVEIARLTPGFAFTGQRASVRVGLRGRQVQGKKSDVRVESDAGVELASLSHTWKQPDEKLEADLSFTPMDSGSQRVRVTVKTDGAPPATADGVVRTEDRRPRVFVYEPRASWGISFARQALEGDVLFDVRSLARTSRGLDVRSADAPRAFTSLDPETADVVIVGGLDALTSAELAVLQRFMRERGGVVLLVPDGTLPEPVRTAFDLPAFRVSLLEQPVTLTLGALGLRASEVFAASGALIERDSQLVVLAGLDAWRYRGADYEAFWRALVAGLATRAIPKIDVRLEPALVRSGEPVTVRVALRTSDRQTALPPVSASIVSPNGVAEPFRLWPGTRVGEFLGTVHAPAAGTYDVRVNVDGALRDEVLIVDDDAVAPITHYSTSTATDVGTLAGRLRTLDRGTVVQRAWPMRSPWWAVAFAAVLGAEWTLRRRKGLR